MNLGSVIEILAVCIEEYENEHYPISEGNTIDCLKFLMQEQGIQQKNLTEIGSQGVVSEILAGKRQLTVRHSKALSKRVNVSPVVA